MTYSIVANEPIFVTCPRNEVCGDHCDECNGMGEVAEDISALMCLAHNLAIAGALCRAFALGEYFERDMAWPPGTWRRDCAWAPGCGKAAP